LSYSPLGPGFAAGTTNGPGMFGLQQGVIQRSVPYPLFSFYENLILIFRKLYCLLKTLLNNILILTKEFFSLKR